MSDEMEQKKTKALEKKIGELYTAVDTLRENHIAISDAINQMNSQLNSLIVAFEEMHSRFLVVAGLLESKKVINKKEYDASLEQLQIEEFFENKEEAIKRFMLEMTKKFNEIDENIEKQNRRRVARKMKYQKRYNGTNKHA